MGTLISVQVVEPSQTHASAVERAFEWFYHVESLCTRFDPQSELMQLKAGVAVSVSPILFEAIKFALLVAEESHGAFDPTIGQTMELRGFDREHRTGQQVRSAVPAAKNVTYRDVTLDENRKTILLRHPLTLDLGSVAKGLAIDLAARELEPVRSFAIDAGGDLYLSGRNPQGQPWRTGIRHPREAEGLIRILNITDRAVCTSGDYERRAPGGHHILDPRSGDSPNRLASATVIAEGAMLADALATAAFVMGPQEGLAFLERMEVDGLLITPELEIHQTRSFPVAT